MTKEQYLTLKLTDLRAVAKEAGVKGISAMKKNELIEALLAFENAGKANDSVRDEKRAPEKDENLSTKAREPEAEYAVEAKGSPEGDDHLPEKAVIEGDAKENNTAAEVREPFGKPPADVLSAAERKDDIVTGILEVMSEGYGFMRSDNFLSGESDIYVSPSQIRRFNLKTGDQVTGLKRPRAQGEKYGALLYIYDVNGESAESARHRPVFEKMTPIFPDKRIKLERPGGSKAARIVDLLSPIGKGQRGMIVSPPKAGKTTLLKEIALSILGGDPETHLIILLIDERPEEVTDMKESVRGKNVEIIYSTFDEQPEHHKRVSEMVIERGKRLVEHGKDAIILLDSITRLTRAYNVLIPPSGRTLSGGLDPVALYMPKRFFGAARNMREGGSLTILATALVDTGSKMDDVVYEEFKGTGNMELILDRRLQERRIFPAIDIARSGTRKEDLLLSPEELKAAGQIRRRLNGAKPEEAADAVIGLFAQTPNNAALVHHITTKWAE